MKYLPETAKTMSLHQIFSGSDEPVNDCSGGGDCNRMKCSYGFSNVRGRRPSMEDYSGAHFRMKDRDVYVGLFGVFDGHGGTRVADYVCENLFNNLLDNPKLVKDPERAIIEAYQKTDKEFLDIESQEEHEYDAGTTASTAVLVGNRLIVANVGDSRAVVCMGGKAVALSTDHKPDHQDERLRIEQAGGVVVWAGTWRVDGILAVSRAFGDKNLKQYVVAEPAIKEETVNERLEFLILASDGLWDVLSNQDAINIVRPIHDAEEAAKELTREAYHKGSMDNITCMVVRFHSAANYES